MDQPYPWLKYVDASDVDDRELDVDQMNVESPTGEHLGDVDGFIVDSESGRPYYVVVDAGGWFKSKHFLLPVGHVRVDEGNEVLRADLTRDQVDRFPGYDKDKFDTMTPADLKRLNQETLQACAVSGTAFVLAEDASYTAAWEQPDFRYPEWWRSRRADQRPTDRVGTGTVPASAESAARASREPREAVVNRAEESPHFEGRAQPGDVIGIETGGETTGIGDTTDDENKRREAAEEAARRRD